MAAISILAGGYAVYSAVYESDSKVRLGQVAVNGTQIRVVATNTGDAAASVEDVGFKSKFLDVPVNASVVSSNDAYLPTGSKLLTFEIKPAYDSDQAYGQSLKVLKAELVDKSKEHAAELVVAVANSNGSRALHVFELSNDQMFRLLRAHSDKCLILNEQPTYENGCFGINNPDGSER